MVNIIKGQLAVGICLNGILNSPQTKIGVYVEGRTLMLWGGTLEEFDEITPVMSSQETLSIIRESLNITLKDYIYEQGQNKICT